MNIKTKPGGGKQMYRREVDPFKVYIRLPLVGNSTGLAIQML